MIAATVAPSAGRTPTKVPMHEERSNVQRTFRKSALLGSLTTTDVMRSYATFAARDCPSSSLTAKSPISTGTKWMPSVSSYTPKVKRSTPLVRCTPTVPSRMPSAPAIRLRIAERPLIEASMESAGTGSSVSVNGMSSATAIGEDSPGRAPTVVPTSTPIRITMRLNGSRTWPNPWARSSIARLAEREAEAARLEVDLEHVDEDERHRRGEKQHEGDQDVVAPLAPQKRQQAAHQHHGERHADELDRHDDQNQQARGKEGDSLQPVGALLVELAAAAGDEEVLERQQEGERDDAPDHEAREPLRADVLGEERRDFVEQRRRVVR